MLAFDLPTYVLKIQRDLIKAGWIFQMARVQRGKCIYSTQTIVLPAWLLHKSESYQVYYLCHEMAHALAGHKALHGPAFMAELRRICPPQDLHWEALYKPRNALAAGIVYIAEDF